MERFPYGQIQLDYLPFALMRSVLLCLTKSRSERLTCAIGAGQTEATRTTPQRVGQ